MDSHASPSLTQQEWVPLFWDADSLYAKPLEVCERLLQVGDEIIGPLSLYNYVVNICLDVVAD
jgi:hypothetical protein